MLSLVDNCLTSSVVVLPLKLDKEWAILLFVEQYDARAFNLLYVCRTICEQSESCHGSLRVYYAYVGIFLFSAASVLCSLARKSRIMTGNFPIVCQSVPDSVVVPSGID